MEVRDIFAKMVRKRLEELGWKQHDLAERLGLANTSGISKVLTEGRSPRSDTVILWARALKTTPNYLLDIPETSTQREPTTTEMVIFFLEKLGLEEEKLNTIKQVLSYEEFEAHALNPAQRYLLELGEKVGTQAAINHLQSFGKSKVNPFVKNFVSEIEQKYRETYEKLLDREAEIQKLKAKLSESKVAKKSS